MPLLEWSNSMSVGLERIDNEHRKLIDIINDVSDAIRDDKAGEITEWVLSDMTDYTEYHFSTEEVLMKENAYPKAAEHIKEHEEFKAKLRELQEQYKLMKGSVSMIILRFLKEWLVRHILDTDKELVFFLNKQ